MNSGGGGRRGLLQGQTSWCCELLQGWHRWGGVEPTPQSLWEVREWGQFKNHCMTWLSPSALYLHEGYFTHVNGSTSNWGHNTQTLLLNSVKTRAVWWQEGRWHEGDQDRSADHKSKYRLLITSLRWQLAFWCPNVDLRLFVKPHTFACWARSRIPPLSQLNSASFITSGYFLICFLIPLLLREKRKGKKVNNWRHIHESTFHSSLFIISRFGALFVGSHYLQCIKKSLRNTLQDSAIFFLKIM